MSDTLREDLSYLIEYVDTLIDAQVKIEQNTEVFKNQVFNEDSDEEMLAILRRLSMEYRVTQSIAASGRQRCNDMIRKMEGEDR